MFTPYISVHEILMGRDVEFPLTEEHQVNLQKLLMALNAFRWIYGKPMTVTSGYRPGRFNKLAGGAKASAHLSCEACDFADADGSLAAWCLANLVVLQRCRLWLEDPTDTKGWIHLQIRPVANRVFMP